MPASGDDTFRGREGPLRVTNPEPREPIFQTIIKAAAEVGIPHNPDYNGASQEGIAMSQATIAAGRRMSTARCYLDPIRNRQNLHIETGALDRAACARRQALYRRALLGAAMRREAAASREVVVCGGTINSPQLLELSGIGQPERLRDLGIEVRHALPGVGENLRDHYAPRTRWLVGKRGVTFNDRARGLGMVYQAMRYALFREGMLASVGAPMRAFVCSREGLEAPDLMLGLGPDADRTRPERAAHIPAIGLYLLCPSDAAGEQGTYPHHLGRSAPTARDQFQFSVVAARCGADRVRGPHRPRDHDRAGDGAVPGKRNRARRRSDHR